jgi:hypothetical protein
MIEIWETFLKKNGGTNTNAIPSPRTYNYDVEGITFFYTVEIALIEKYELPVWDYSGSFFERQLNEINQKQKTNYKFTKSVLISGEYLQELYKEYKQKIIELVSFVKNRVFEYDEDDTSTWVDNFIPIVWESEKVYFSHETPEGELLWNLYGSLEPLKEEIDLGGALCVVVID